MASCKECKNRLEKDYVKNHKKERKISSDKYTKNHSEEIKERANKRRKENLEKFLEKDRIFRENHRQERAEGQRKYYFENKETILGREKINRQKPERVETRRKYLMKNKDKIKILHIKYRKNNRKKLAMYEFKRREKIKSLPNSLTVEQWEDIKNFFNYSCCYCGNKTKLEKDHFIPLSRNGELTQNNIVPSCKSCNSSKGNNKFKNWYKNQPFYSAKREEKVLKYLGYKEDKQQLKLI